jgi:hypothetical protein
MKTYRVQCRLGNRLIVSTFDQKDDKDIKQDFIKQLKKGNASVSYESVYRPDRIFFFYEEIPNDSKQRLVG